MELEMSKYDHLPCGTTLMAVLRYLFSYHDGMEAIFHSCIIGTSLSLNAKVPTRTIICPFLYFKKGFNIFPTLFFFFVKPPLDRKTSTNQLYLAMT